MIFSPRIKSLALALLPIVSTLELPEYVGLKTSLNAGILEVTLHNPNSEVNLWNQDTQDGLEDLVGRLQADRETKVVIFKSDVPQFFMAHVDLSVTTIGPSFADIIYNISTLPQVTIGAVEGRARGGGNELLVSLDMRFATKEAVFGQPEVGLGLFPGGGGSQFLPGLIGRGLAMEYILSSKDISAVEAARIGWINSAFDTSAEMYAYINGITSRCRLFPLSAIKSAKDSINLASGVPLENIRSDIYAFEKQFADPEVQALQFKIGSIAANFTAVEAELNLADFLLKAYE